MQEKSADSVITSFTLQPHPFDGWFAPVETGQHPPMRFYYMIREGEYAAWHRTTGRMVITHIDGAPLSVSLADGGRATHGRRLHNDQENSCLIEETEWRCWQSLGHWSLAIVSVERAEHFLQWHLAPDDWHPQPG